MFLSIYLPIYLSLSSLFTPNFVIVVSSIYFHVQKLMVKFARRTSHVARRLSVGGPSPPTILEVGGAFSDDGSSLYIKEPAIWLANCQTQKHYIFLFLRGTGRNGTERIILYTYLFFFFFLFVCFVFVPFIHGSRRRRTTTTTTVQSYRSSPECIVFRSIKKPKKPKNKQ